MWDKLKASTLQLVLALGLFLSNIIFYSDIMGHPYMIFLSSVLVLVSIYQIVIMLIIINQFKIFTYLKYRKEIMALLRYSFEEVTKYKYLTRKEKEIIPSITDYEKIRKLIIE